MSGAVIFGFDSAWSGRNRGAICALEIGSSGEPVSFTEPEAVNFDEAAEFIKNTSPKIIRRLAAVDQPVIVENQGGSRPADKVAASVISYVGGGVQPANRSKEVFNDNALIWRFLEDAGIDVKSPDVARRKISSMLGVEVFPALALTGFNPKFAKKKTGHPKYNPGNRKKFRIED